MRGHVDDVVTLVAATIYAPVECIELKLSLGKWMMKMKEGEAGLERI